MTYELRRVKSRTEWEAYHDIRERVLWINRGHVGVYDREHPDDRKPDHHPFLLLHHGEPTAVARLDLDPPGAWLRRVAVRADMQRRGHGRKLLEMIRAFAVANNCARLCSRVDSAAVGFYQRLGFTERSGGVSPEGTVMELKL